MSVLEGPDADTSHGSQPPRNARNRSRQTTSASGRGKNRRERGEWIIEDVKPDNKGNLLLVRTGWNINLLGKNPAYKRTLNLLKCANNTTAYKTV